MNLGYEWVESGGLNVVEVCFFIWGFNFKGEGCFWVKLREGVILIIIDNGGNWGRGGFSC